MINTVFPYFFLVGTSLLVGIFIWALNGAYKAQREYYDQLRIMTDIMKRGKPLKRTPMKRSSKKMKRNATGELDLFKKIWEEREHRSFISGRTVEPFDIRNFAHVLPKSKYPSLRLDRENIVLLSPVEHALFDQHTEKDREKHREEMYHKHGAYVDWEKLYELKEQIKHDKDI